MAQPNDPFPWCRSWSLRVSSLRRLLRREAGRSDDRKHVPDRVSNAEIPLDEVTDAPKRPKFRAEACGERTGEECGELEPRAARARRQGRVCGRQGGTRECRSQPGARARPGRHPHQRPRARPRANRSTADLDEAAWQAYATKVPLTCLRGPRMAPRPQRAQTDHDAVIRAITMACYAHACRGGALRARARRPETRAG
jgi:hypothetical protein